MIALVGQIRRLENGGWEWNGTWAFALIPGIKPERQPAHVRIGNSPRPFSYQFSEVREASKVPVPLREEELKSFEENNKKNKGVSDSCNDGLEKKQPPSPKSSQKNTVRPAESNAGILVENVTGSPIFFSEHKQSNGDISAIASSVEKTAVGSRTIEFNGRKKVNKSGHSKVARQKDESCERDSEPIKSVSLESSTGQETSCASETVASTFPVFPGGSKSAASKNSKSSIKAETASDKDTSRSSLIPSRSENDKSSKSTDNAESLEEKIKDSTKSSPGSTEITYPTYASISSFRDASIDNPETCPTGGLWKGSFQNVKPRKKEKDPRLVEKIEESFVLFFNSQPAAHAKVTFFEKESNGLLSADGIHVRGSGSNQFGTFELLGSFDKSTSSLKCHRLYLPDVRSPRKPRLRSQIRPKGQRSKRQRSISNADGADDLTESKDLSANSDYVDGQVQPYNTRKKIMSWKRPSWNNEDVSADFVESSPPKKKPRQLSVQPPIAVSSSANNISSSNTVSASLPASQETSTAVSAHSGKEAKVNQTTSKIEAPTKKESSKSKTKGKSLSKSSKQLSSVVLPSERDPMDCLWRSAHFYAKGKNKNESNNVGDFSTSETENQCVYEGEFNAGNYFREGLGVCLFSHGNIYEGSWRRDNTHGRGVLRTGDRRHIIYEGEWERGKMHGKGVYYYHVKGSATSNTAESVIRRVGVYEGDFKENLRHGYGLYSFPDGSFYEGEWRDNVRCGKGNFQWVDGSSFVGQWKDGKRHGQGILKASDGFTYEGQWVMNAMDGRGCCVYPNGQRYEGMWSRGKKEGRGTVYFTNGAIYEGRFRNDGIEGQGTMKISRCVSCADEGSDKDGHAKDGSDWTSWMIPIEFQSDMERIHQKAGFTSSGI
mmetsp:Transcript_40127/g.94295  ORF Transcript_40127/g.94295 Transcript_40127/m.94295 type:complete len:887 (-) Transcript_40127:266-2926(-)|eukprot:CAMPEP_0113297714 /NCGR_PEP_ID=MMETSP0010_2-20120614/461_1 /TAXON_ID=216773 ORGANISM="Corethron hystrix, Strain 308" /NCGR_SAMPLE_ID=MMETSP0010_2 /ASSEMBLY_ACC=CAM_ASM_000155 /LENGTH=886 /DNA_ID=CAMNT_0000150649 /DNA_START=51 /DNA_END=2711 /DNA_ORIENTATION=- /assembly_acc=CAM_ASM_000155